MRHWTPPPPLQRVEVGGERWSGGGFPLCLLTPANTDGTFPPQSACFVDSSPDVLTVLRPQSTGPNCLHSFHGRPRL